jgi:hypothetical protein
MMTYSISTRTLTMPDGTTYLGHSGHGIGLNNPNAVDLVGVGPLPPAIYSLGPWQDSKDYGPGDARLGPLVSRLTPEPGSDMMGRSGFFFHGGNGTNPPTDSDGCIVLQHDDRQAVCDSGETQVTVIL